MPFKYVLIPASACDEMQELEFDTDIDDLSKDTFRTHIEQYYANFSQSVDRSVLMAQLKERTGVDLAEKTKSGDMPEEALERLLSSTSVEIFPVQLPMKATQFLSVSAYCDDKGVAKELEENTRMSGLVQACGYPGQTFRGDCFIGRVFDDTEDEWRRVDFTLKDCDSEAGWVKQVKAQRANRSSSDMSSLADKMGMNKQKMAHIDGSQLESDIPTGETEEYRWKQAGDEVEITFKRDSLTKGDKKAVKVLFKREKIKVEVKGEVLLDGPLSGPVDTDECTWTLLDGVLQVNLTKASEDNWQTLLKE